ncbi:MAG: hypothetical protein EOP50_13790, partial [Sphingobacteriales bacterium]
MLAAGCRSKALDSTALVEEAMRTQERRLSYAKELLLITTQDRAREPGFRNRTERYLPAMMLVDSLYRDAKDSLDAWPVAGWGQPAEAARRCSFIKAFPGKLCAIHPLLREEMPGIDLLTGSVRKESPEWTTLPDYIGRIDTGNRRQLLELLRMNLLGVTYHAEEILDEQTRGAEIFNYEKS